MEIVLVLLSLPIEIYLYGVVAGEVYSSWPRQTLEAQAVLARTYALYNIEHPRGKGFHLYGDARSQNYEPSKRRLETDLAVENTKGIYIADMTGNIPLIEYVSKCGRSDCPYCQGKPGHTTKGNQSGVWPDRVCQYGMKVLALQGLDYQSIIRHFVGYEIQFMEREETEDAE